ncbi:PAS domain S-box protein [Dongia rigui]|uniref:histidine kinase n=1 Tax=Dongia rigui TaxID=940149 RepID=A0ABU5DVF3_9PROT|nr:PAS domain S-box protein [Dongia rigui]MDY0871304.1 PAS domain S-box protein [Dongia rigui]
MDELNHPNGPARGQSTDPADARLAADTLNALPIAVCVVDADGRVLCTNPAWVRLADVDHGRTNFKIGDNCFDHLARVAAAGDTMAAEIAAGLRAVINGESTEFVRKDVRCLSQPHDWFDVLIKAIDGDGPRRCLMMLDDVSERQRALGIISESAARHRHAERIARLGHWRLEHRGDDWRKGCIEYSEEAAAILGLEPGITNHDFDDIKRRIHPDDLARVLAIYEADHPEGYVVEYRVRRSDGTCLTVQETGESVETGRYASGVEFGTIQDVSAQRQDADRLRRLNDELEQLVAERTAALAERESQLRRAQALAKIGHYTWHHGPSGEQLSDWPQGLNYSQAIADIFGVTPSELVVSDAAYIERFVHPDDRAHVRDSYRQQDEAKLANCPPLEYRILRPDGAVRHVVEIIETVAGGGDDVVQVLGMIQDITASKAAELAQHDSEARLQAFLDNAPFIMSIKDVEGRLLMINREGAESYEVPQENLHGHLTEELLPDAAGRTITAMSREVMATGRVVTKEVQLPTYERYHWSLEIEFPIRDSAGRINAIGGFAVDISEQKKAELALRESEARLRAIFDHVPVTLSLSNPAGRYTMINRRFLDKVGKGEDEVIGHTAEEVFGPDGARLLVERKAQVQRTLASVTYEARTPTEMGARDCAFTHFPIIDDGVLTAIGTISLDLTEQRTAEAALQQAQKMELVGQLTGGLAHDFNNLLGAIIGNLDLLALDIKEERGRTILQRAVSAAERGASLIHRLLAFSRRQTLSPRLVDVNRQIQEMRPLLEHSLGSGLTIVVRGSAHYAFARVDPVQLEAALLNLAINARDAMPDGGRLVIETANVTMAVRDLSGNEPGSYIMIVVSDQGTGMTPEVLEKSIEPFFTTKPVGKGTGLGLSMVHGFVKQSGGNIHIDSQVGRGTTVGLFLPCANEGAEEADWESDASVALRRGKGEKILFVGRGGPVQSECMATLQKLGYACLVAGDANMALLALSENADIKLLITDMLLPGSMHGADLSGAARRSQDGLRVLQLAGLSDAEARLESSLPPDDLLLTMPFRARDLLALVTDLMSEVPA